MATNPKFEPVPGARHRIESVDGVEWMTVRAARNWFILPFITVWLIGWTFGGIVAMTSFAMGEARGFLAVWLAFWAVGWVFAAATVLWQIGGKSAVAATGGALVYRWSMPIISHSRHYDVAQVRHLRTQSSPFSALFSGFSRSPYPPFFPMTGGAVAFDYGARTVRFFPEVDEAEGRMVVDWLSRRLPAGALRD